MHRRMKSSITILVEKDVMITLQIVLHGGSKRRDVGDRGVVFRGACFRFWTRYHFLKRTVHVGKMGGWTWSVRII